MFAAVWAFEVDEERRADFERAYGPDGDWADLFRLGEGYLGTELLADAAKPGRYLAIDRCRSSNSFDGFMAAHGGVYEALDARLAGLASREVPLGRFDVVDRG